MWPTSSTQTAAVRPLREAPGTAWAWERLLPDLGRYYFSECKFFQTPSSLWACFLAAYSKSCTPAAWGRFRTGLVQAHPRCCRRSRGGIFTEERYLERAPILILGPRRCSRTRSVAGRLKARIHVCPQSCLPGAGRVSVRPQRDNKKPRELALSQGDTDHYSDGSSCQTEPTRPWSPLTMQHGCDKQPCRGSR